MVQPGFFSRYVAAFCTIDGKKESFLSRVEDQVVESYCMKEVFNMESSVRVEAIENLGIYGVKICSKYKVVPQNFASNNLISGLENIFKLRIAWPWANS